MATIDTVLREEIFFIDLLLSGDNAIVIALACRGLPAQQVPKAVAFGAAGPSSSGWSSRRWPERC